MKLLVCGGADFSDRINDRAALFSALDRAHARRPILLVVTCEGSGAERLAAGGRAMPVAPGLPDLTEHHGSTDKPYGCHNRAPYPAVSVAPNGTAWPFRMAPDCQYTLTDLGRTDPRCSGCRWRNPIDHHPV